MFLVPHDIFSARKPLDDDDMLSVLERCFSVLQERRNSGTVSALSNGGGQTNSGRLSNWSTLTKNVNRLAFDSVKTRLTSLDHNLYDVIWPSVKKLPSEPAFKLAVEQDFPLGVAAPDYHSYYVFYDFLEPIIKDYNHISPKCEVGPQPPSKFRECNDGTDLDLDPESKWVMAGNIECTRNLTEYDLPKSLNIHDLEAVERVVTDVLLTSRLEDGGHAKKDPDSGRVGTYYTLTEILEDLSETRMILASNNLLVPLWNISDSDRLHGRHWPYGRGVYIDPTYTVAVYVNILDHVRVVTSTTPPGNLGKAYDRLARLMDAFQTKLEFKFDERLGFLTSRPNVLGCGLQFKLTLRCLHLTKQSEKSDHLRSLCSVRGLTYDRDQHATGVFKVSNRRTIGVDEGQCFREFATAVANILQLEKDIVMSNSLHIAAMILSVFRRRSSERNGHK